VSVFSIGGLPFSSYNSWLVASRRPAPQPVTDEQREDESHVSRPVIRHPAGPLLRIPYL